RTDLDNEMRMTATQAEAVEREIVRLAVSRYKGRPIGHEQVGYSVQYNKKYVLTSAAELIRQAREFFGIGVHPQTPALGRILLTKVLDAVAKEDDRRYGEALREIEAASLAPPGVMRRPRYSEQGRAGSDGEVFSSQSGV
ncbi:hypothetical protein LCGC14_2233480, partial [marine sediment metagenome]